MKLKELFKLFEEPYDLGQDWPSSVTPAIATPSDAGLKRENILLGTLTLGDESFQFWLANNKLGASVTTKTKKSGERNELILSITFDNRSGLPVKNELQVHTVFNQNHYRGRNLAMAMYVLLARYGFTVVSDFEQYNGGKALWKKMARESADRKFVIRVWSDENEDWLRGNDNEPIAYDGDNIDEFFIWNDSNRKYEATSLLVLSSN